MNEVEKARLICETSLRRLHDLMPEHGCAGHCLEEIRECERRLESAVREEAFKEGCLVAKDSEPVKKWLAAARLAGIEEGRRLERESHS